MVMLGDRVNHAVLTLSEHALPVHKAVEGAVGGVICHAYEAADIARCAAAGLEDQGSGEITCRVVGLLPARRWAALRTGMVTAADQLAGDEDPVPARLG